MMPAKNNLMINSNPRFDYEDDETINDYVLQEDPQQS